MEIKFSNTNVSAIYNRVMTRVETEEGKKRVNNLFRVAAHYDQDPASLNEDEAKMVERNLERVNTETGRISDPWFYSDTEIGKIYADDKQTELAKQLRSTLDDLSRVVLTSIFRINKVAANVYTVDTPHAHKIREIYQKLSKIPGVGTKELFTFWDILAAMAKRQDNYDPETARLREDWNMAGINPSQVMDFNYFYKLAIAAQSYFIEIDFKRRASELDFEPVCEEAQEFEELLVLEKAARDENPRIRQKALLKLGAKLQGEDIIIENIYSGDISWYDGAAPALGAYRALLNFSDERALEVLADRIKNGDFTSLILAGSKLPIFKSLPMVVKLLTEWTNNRDPFLRGEAADLYRYLWHRKEFTPFREKVRNKLIDLAINDKNPLVQASAIETLGYIGDKEGLSVIEKKLAPQENSLPVKILKKALKIAENKGETDPLTYDDTTINATRFFRFPKQLKWAVQKVRAIAAKQQDANSNIEILCMGSSYGMEPISILIALMEDYEQNRAAWGNFDVLRRVKIKGADIDLRVLRYMQRGQFSIFPATFFDELETLDEYCLEFGINTKTFLKKYFEVDNIRGTFTLREKYQAMLSEDYMDVTDPNSMDPSQNHPDIIFYNCVDIYLSQNDQKHAINNLAELKPTYITTTYSRFKNQVGTQAGFRMNNYKRLKLSGGLALYKRASE